ncbi:hypothetical protein QFZ75_007949 [Streptomyces sp. V3I8]|uniref:hypothetical protein n=1 Tax=Streptomyces sp. V3I8 TaxID=3042279 RepID=UPI0027851B39|nr:hypothetical protein [Streptomyces sp. V3I8]MDQ1041447.1 hypothetical protein [Streptomyces sp. V3I8]
MSLNKDMGDAHEAHLAETLGMRQTRGSGNQWRDPIDARHNRLDTAYAFAVDGKSTLAKSISITRTMWEKAVEQAGGEKPMLGLRFYDDGARKVHADLAACDLLDFAELLEAARAWELAKPLVQRFVKEHGLESLLPALAGEGETALLRELLK